MKIKDRPEFANKPKPLTFSPDAKVAAAVSEMSRLNYGSVVIVNGDDKPVGMVTERDIMKRVVNDGRDAATATLADIMTANPRVASDEDDVREWLRIMSNERFRRVPIVDDAGRIKAIMTQGDFVSYTWPDLLYQAKEMTKATISDNRQLALIAGGIAIYTLAVVWMFRSIGAS